MTGAEDAPLAVSFPTQALLADPVMADKMADLALWVAVNGDPVARAAHRDRT